MKDRVGMNTVSVQERGHSTAHATRKEYGDAAWFGV